MSVINMLPSGGAPGIDFKDGVNVPYESAAQTGSASCTTAKPTYVMILMTRSNRNTSDNITWTIKADGETLWNFTASTGRMAQDYRVVKCSRAGVVIQVSCSASSGYAGARSFFISTGTDSIS